MPFSVTWTIGMNTYTRNFPGITNAKIRQLLQRSAIFQGIPIEGRTEQDVVLDLMDADARRHRSQSEHVQRSQLEEANDAAINATLATDNTLT